jgi:hypothetical protein
MSRTHARRAEIDRSDQPRVLKPLRQPVAQTRRARISRLQTLERRRDVFAQAIDIHFVVMTDLVQVRVILLKQFR